MLEFEIAAIYYFIANLIKARAYFEEMPEDFETPCVFYPTPEPQGNPYSQGAFRTEFVMYVKFMDVSTMVAYGNAELVLQEILKERCKIPLVDEDGNVLKNRFRINMPKIKKIENGVYQMEISWKRYTRYTESDSDRAKAIFLNGIPIWKEDENVQQTE